MSKKMSPKQRILHLLKKNHSMTIEGIMEHFTISEVAVRKHIHELEKQGLLTKQAKKQSIGRPYYQYILTKAGHGTFPNQLKTLPLDLLKDLEEIQGSEVVNDLLKKRMQREIDYYESLITSESLAERINQVIHIQNENGYLIEVEKTEQGEFEIRNYNCPILSIASKYDQICENEINMLEQLFSNGTVSVHSLITKGSHVCKWTIKKL
ncbi:metalloregulator ArsR/SmtB family transcription factor [Oceanobacillus sp. Castelsardo]|uniref:helix-turn-helix transcriptional regulator n=1 Tax=Oceanobacillus sp. Castelsardo TaxID=1851204 RepID=UPI000837D81C|nr:DeoR family transcriptional regulator [Oceanobacillus sp. Castelsardo]